MKDVIIAVNPVEVRKIALELSWPSLAPVGDTWADVFGTFSMVRRHLAAGYLVTIVSEDKPAPSI